jgi:hypothetical protein
MASEKDDRRVTRGGPQGLLHHEPVLPGEPYVQDEARRPVWALAAQELAGGRKGLDLHPERADEAG